MAKNQYYKNIYNLRNENVDLEYEQWQVEEIIKCTNDIPYFLSKYVKITNQELGIVPFNLYDYQKRMMDLFEKKNRIVTLLPRQSGKCLEKNTNITLRNKKTGEIMEMTMEEFHELQRKKQNNYK